MAITLERAKALEYGEVPHSEDFRNADGTCQRWRVHGNVKTWKRTPGRVRVPMARGLYQHGYLTDLRLNLFHLESECPRHQLQLKLKLAQQECWRKINK